MTYPILSDNRIGPAFSKLADGLNAASQMIEGERARHERQAALISRLATLHSSFLDRLIEHGPTLGGTPAYRQLADLAKGFGTVLDDWLILFADVDTAAADTLKEAA
jgi:hypothetical protein